MAGKVRIEDRLGLEHGAGNADQAIGDRPERAAMTVATTGSSGCIARKHRGSCAARRHAAPSRLSALAQAGERRSRKRSAAWDRSVDGRATLRQASTTGPCGPRRLRGASRVRLPSARGSRSPSRPDLRAVSESARAEVAGGIRYPGVPQTASRTLVQSVSSTLMRAKYLSLASTSVHGAISVLVRSTMSHTARS